MPKLREIEVHRRVEPDDQFLDMCVYAPPYKFYSLIWGAVLCIVATSFFAIWK